MEKHLLRSGEDERKRFALTIKKKPNIRVRLETKALFIE